MSEADWEEEMLGISWFGTMMETWRWVLERGSRISGLAS